MKKKRIAKQPDINQVIKRKTIIAFSVFVLAWVAGIAGWKMLRSQPKDDNTLAPLRTVLNVNEKVNNLLLNDRTPAKKYRKSEAAPRARVNGGIGMSKNIDLAAWRLNIINNGTKTQIDMGDIYKMQQRDVVFDFKCVEGWSQVTYWSGVRFSDFLQRYKLGTKSGNAPDPNHPEDLYKYVGLMTPDGAYYVGIDMKSMLNPQTILAYELNGKPLPMNQGAPLRLIITVKYGIKSLKRIGSIYFSDTRPKDYWFERGYDYDAGL